jgi:hypothetical protein
MLKRFVFLGFARRFIDNVFCSQGEIRTGKARLVWGLGEFIVSGEERDLRGDDP